MESASKLQSEIDRLLNIIRTSDSDKIDKEAHIRELEEQLHESQSQIGSLKRAQQADRKKNSQLLDEARHRTDAVQNDAEVLRSLITEKEVRVKELEQALRESVRLTAEREAHVASREDLTRQLEHQVRELRSTVEHLQRERNSLSSQLASLQEEIRDREGQLKNLEADCFQGYIPELEKLRRANQEANLRIAALVKLVQGHGEHLTEEDKSVLATVPLFPSLSQKGGTSAGSMRAQSRGLGPVSGTGEGHIGLLAPGTTFGRPATIGGSVSPNFAGSAFHLIGPSSAPTASASVGGMNLTGQSVDSVFLGRLLHEKELMLHQQLQELTRLRFQNSELEVRIKSIQRELEDKATRLSTLEGVQAAAGVSGLVDWQSQISGMPINQAELATLRQSNTEMREKLLRLQTSLQDRESELMRVQSSQSSASALEIERLKFEECNLRFEMMNAKEELTKMQTTASTVDVELQEKRDKIRLLEFEKTKAVSDFEELQKKYHNLLSQFNEKSDKLQQIEQDCERNHIREFQRFKKESDELSHRVSYLHKTIQEREVKLEQQETELSRLKEEALNSKKKNQSLEAESKSLREDITYKDERLKQLQAQHADELARMRSLQQEQRGQLSILQLSSDEKDHELKSIQGDLEKAKSDLEYTKCRLQETEVEHAEMNTELTQKGDRLRIIELECQSQKDELGRLQVALEESKSKANIFQKRVEEREQRLRKIEGENHDLLDEIHSLRKRNHELESHIDVLRQRLLDRGEQTIPPSSMPSSRLFQGTPEKPSAKVTLEIENLRRRNSEIENELITFRKQARNLQTQVDQLTCERESLNKSYEDEVNRRMKIEKSSSERQSTIDSVQESSIQVERMNLTVNQLKLELERKDSQIQDLKMQLSQAEKLSRMSSGPGTDRDAITTEIKLSLQRTQQALDTANDQNRILQARTEATLLESQQKHLIQRQALQEQLTRVEQTLAEVNSQNDRLQRELRQSSSRIQELNRQLRETQANCDSIASQRDALQSRIEQSSGGMRSFSGTSGSSILGRPASVAAGYSDLMLPLSGGVTSGGQLSRELDRLHREQEVTRVQLETAERSARQFKQEAETARSEVVQLKEDLQHQLDLLHDMEQDFQKREEAEARRTNSEKEKCQRMNEDLVNRLDNLQKQVVAKDILVEQLTSQLKTGQENCQQLSEKLIGVNQELEALNSQHDQVALERNQQQRLSYELETVKKELTVRENQFNQLTQKYNQSLKDASDQSQVIDELSRQLEAAKLITQRAEQGVDEARRQAAAWANEQMQAQQHRLQTVSTEQTQRDRETIAALKADLDSALNAKSSAEQKVSKLENDLKKQVQALDLAVEHAHATEEVCQQEHLHIIDKLSQENQDLKSTLNEANRAQTRSTNVETSVTQTLKQEIDVLKKELDKRDTVIANLEKECQEKHVRKLEALQVQLRRYEEESANLNHVLDEQRNGIEERDRLVRQLRSEGQNATGGVELSKLQAEHARCGQQLQQKQQQLNTLMKQLEQQAEEILTTKLEALTASLCEKDANIALIQINGTPNGPSNQAMQKLQSERETIQSQLRQLTFARDALAEQRIG